MTTTTTSVDDVDGDDGDDRRKRPLDDEGAEKTKKDMLKPGKMVRKGSKTNRKRPENDSKTTRKLPKTIRKTYGNENDIMTIMTPKKRKN